MGTLAFVGPNVNVNNSEPWQLVNDLIEVAE